ncbi:MAG: hypothetical protein K1X81_05465 [Bacteroidia bacterium]|nr:hypothetical protein [Bacteroidia bacterium]
MKLASSLFIAMLSVMSISCNINDVSISYPENSQGQQNILALPDGAKVNQINAYIFAADIGDDAQLKIVITNLSNDKPTMFSQKPSWALSTTNRIGWTVMGEVGGTMFYPSNYQIAEAAQTGKLNMPVHFVGTANIDGKCRIDFYENSGKITKTKYLVW